MTDHGRELWQRASALAARMHAGQTRKDGRTPYFSHCARVAMTVRDVFGCGDPAVLAAAFLHDTIEDTPADFDDILHGFGPDVASIVAALTKNMILPEAQREADYDRRLEAADWRARLIKLADVIDNAGDLASRPDGSAPETIARNAEKLRRAIDLARGDADAHPETARAIEEAEAASRGLSAG